MIRRILSLLLSLSAAGLAGNIDLRAATITFQHGLNGYSGCQDSFIPNSGYSDDYNINLGINRFLIVNSDHWNSG